MGKRELTSAERRALEAVRRGLLRYERAKARAEAEVQREREAGSTTGRRKAGGHA